MAELVPTNTAFEVNAQAARLREIGLASSLSGEFDKALGYFGEAQEILRELANPEFHESRDVLLGATVQSAAIRRDTGSVFIRRAISTSDPEDLDIATTNLTVSLDSTEKLLSKYHKTASATVTPRFKRRRETLSAQHGFTISMMGRVATVRETIFGLTSDEDPIDHYSLADSYLNKGNNTNLAITNAMVAARQERIRGEHSGMLVWLTQATFRTAKDTVKKPHTNVGHSAFRDWLPTLKNREVAIASVKTKP